MTKVDVFIDDRHVLEDLEENLHLFLEDFEVSHVDCFENFLNMVTNHVPPFFITVSLAVVGQETLPTCARA